MTASVFSAPTPARRRFGRLSRRHVIGAVVVVLIALVTLAPVAFLIFSSFNVSAPGEPTAYGLENWRAAFDDERFASGARVSLGFGGRGVTVWPDDG